MSRGTFYARLVCLTIAVGPNLQHCTQVITCVYAIQDHAFANIFRCMQITMFEYS